MPQPDKALASRTARRFTLVELLAAMAVLIVLMAMLFTFFSSAQRAWSLTETNSRIYESAQILFDVMGRDLQAAVFSDEEGRRIPFYFGDESPGTGQQLAFVAAGLATGKPAGRSGHATR